MECYLLIFPIEKRKSPSVRNHIYISHIYREIFIYLFHKCVLQICVSGSVLDIEDLVMNKTEKASAFLEFTFSVGKAVNKPRSFR